MAIFTFRGKLITHSFLSLTTYHLRVGFFLLPERLHINLRHIQPIKHIISDNRLASNRPHTRLRPDCKVATDPSEHQVATRGATCLLHWLRHHFFSRQMLRRLWTPRLRRFRPVVYVRLTQGSFGKHIVVVIVHAQVFHYSFCLLLNLLLLLFFKTSCNFLSLFPVSLQLFIFLFLIFSFLRSHPLLHLFVLACQFIQKSLMKLNYLFSLIPFFGKLSKFWFQLWLVVF